MALEARFQELLDADSLRLADIQAAAFGGIPDQLRAPFWQLLLGYLPLNKADRSARLARTRAQYASFREDFNVSQQEADEAKEAESPIVPGEVPTDAELWLEIAKDVSRTHSELAWFADANHSQPMKRILYVYAKLNSGVRYIQGMNELLAPIWFVMAGGRRSDSSGAGSDRRPSMLDAEADAFFVFMSLMSEVRDVFIKAHDHSDTGVKGQLTRYAKLLGRREPAVAAHLDKLGMDHTFYAFRWITMLLCRELSFPDVICLWDSLLADPARFSFLHTVCVAMIRLQRDTLLACDFGRAMKLLQSYPPVDFLHLLAVAMELRALENAENAAAKQARAGPAAPVPATPTLSAAASASASASAAAAAVAPAVNASVAAAASAATAALSSFTGLLRSWTSSGGSGSGASSSGGVGTSGGAGATAAAAANVGEAYKKLDTGVSMREMTSRSSASTSSEAGGSSGSSGSSSSGSSSSSAGGHGTGLGPHGPPAAAAAASAGGAGGDGKEGKDMLWRSVL